MELKPGQILRHVTLDQKVVVGERKDVAGMVFWEVSLASHSVTPEKPWMIHEPHLLEQYKPTQEEKR